MPSNNAELFKASFTKHMMKALSESEQPAHLAAGFFKLHQELSSKETPTLSTEVVTAICLYKIPEHKANMHNWLKTKRLNEVDADGNTVLHHATLSGKLQWVNLLIKKGALIDKTNNIGNSPLVHAVDIASKIENPSLRIKIVSCIESLLKAGAKATSGHVTRPKSAMCIASQNGDLEMVKLLHSNNVNVNDTMMQPALWWAKHSTIDTADVIKYLEDHEAVDESPSMSPSF